MGFFIRGMIDIFVILIGIGAGFWFFAPAYLANAMASIVGKLLTDKGWNAPIDFGRKWKDGKPLLGPGKTWGGLLGGALFGGITGTLEYFIVPFIDTSLIPYWADSLFLVNTPIMLIWRGFILGFGALVGDAVKSFFKRRAGKKRGEFWFPCDQIDFVVGAIVFAIPFLWPVPIETLLVLMAFILISIPIHIAGNSIAYKLKIKEPNPPTGEE